jgi:hypothetical protein
MQIDVYNSIVTLLVQIISGIVLYSIMAVILDKTAKKIAVDVVSKVRGLG